MNNTNSKLSNKLLEIRTVERAKGKSKFYGDVGISGILKLFGITAQSWKITKLLKKRKENLLNRNILSYKNSIFELLPEFSDKEKGELLDALMKLCVELYSKETNYAEWRKYVEPLKRYSIKVSRYSDSIKGAYVDYNWESLMNIEFFFRRESYR